MRTRFGETTDDNLSSGMKSLLVLSWYIHNKKEVTIDLSSCGSKHIGLAFSLIAESGLGIKVLLRHLCVYDIQNKILYKGKLMNNQEYLEFQLKER